MTVRSSSDASRSSGRSATVPASVPFSASTAVALALLDIAQRQRRPFALLGFDDIVKQEVIVKPGEKFPAAELFLSCGGGTEISSVVSRGLDIIEQNPGAMRKADIVLITDGGRRRRPRPRRREVRPTAVRTID